MPANRRFRNVTRIGSVQVGTAHDHRGREKHSKLASDGTLPGILRQLSGLGGCTHPIRLDGHRTEYDVDTATGEIGRILQHLDSTSLPAGQLLVRCNNRRTTRCLACAESTAATPSN